MYIILVFILFTLSSCNVQKPVQVAHVERIEEKLMPVAVGADTIEIAINKNLPTNDTNNHKSICEICEICGGKEDNLVKIKSTRAVNIQRTKTDTSQTLRITLRPDTVYLPYTTHIRSDTIVVQDKICKTKLQKTQTANVVLILILIAMLMLAARRAKLV